MHISSLAPLLSAAESVLCIWIMSAPSSDGRARDDFDHAVMLGLGQRTALGDADQVALVRTDVVLRVQLGRPADDLAQQAVLHLALDQDGDRLVHLVADDATLEGARLDRKSTRLNSSHPSISYAVFCLKKKIYNISMHER